MMSREDPPLKGVGRAGVSLQLLLPLQLPLQGECRQGTYDIPLFLKDGTTALLKAAIKGYNNVIEELLKFSPTLGLLKVSSETLRFLGRTQEGKGSDERPGIYDYSSGR